jgi:hypothetical protein
MDYLQQQFDDAMWTGGRLSRGRSLPWIVQILTNPAQMERAKTTHGGHFWVPLFVHLVQRDQS